MMKPICIFLITVGCLLAAGDDAAKPADITSAQLGDILKELREIHVLLAKQQQAAVPQPAPPLEKAKVSASGYSLGRADAPLTLVEFADYQCPFCRQFHSTVFQRLKKEYIDTGKVRFVSRDLPLDMHSNALAAAEASRCAGDQNRFWEMRDALITHADHLEAASLTGYAQQLGLKMDQFQSCMSSEKFVPEIRADIAEAAGVQILGTPAFVLGKTSSTAFEGVKLIGAQPYEAFVKALSGQETK